MSKMETNFKTETDLKYNSTKEQKNNNSNYTKKQSVGVYF